MAGAFKGKFASTALSAVTIDATKLVRIARASIRNVGQVSANSSPGCLPEANTSTGNGAETNDEAKD
jgi:hypothetical protein